MLFELVDKIIYINLDERKDRREQLETEFLHNIPSDKIMRFSAIKDVRGYIGCTRSHIACLDIAIKNNWNNVMIVEDDAMWNNFDEGYIILQKIIKNPYDVITLGGVKSIYDHNTYKLKSCQTATCYIVAQHYFLKQMYITNLL